jgi:uncharacterized protein YbjT (DUF2867 family)
MIAVMGAAGNVGSKVADLLLRQDQPVRVLEHRRRLEELGRRGAEVVAGDQIDPGDLGVLLKDAEAALVVLPDVVTDPEFTATRSRMSQAITDALAASGVGTSSPSAPSPPASPAPPVRQPGCASSRAAVRAGDRNVLVLRSPFYMENLLAALPLIKARASTRAPSTATSSSR